jgi:hypothetical protein
MTPVNRDQSAATAARNAGANACARIEELRLTAHKLSDSAEGIVNA